MLNLIILMSHINKTKDFSNDLWIYQFIETFFLFLTYYWLNRVIWKNLQQNHLFTIQNVLDFYSKQCLNTTKSLLSQHLLFIDGISQIIMEYIGPNPLPQFNFIATNLKNSICHLDVVYVSRVITLVFSIYSVFKIYSNSFYDQHDSNIFVALGTGIGVLMFGHMIRRLASHQPRHNTITITTNEMNDCQQEASLYITVIIWRKKRAVILLQQQMY